MSHAIQTLEKYPRESRLYSWNFAAKMSYGEEIDTWETTVAGGAEAVDDDVDDVLTVDDEAASGAVVQMRFAAGVSGTKYKITVVAVTNLGNTLQLEGYLLVL